MTTADRVSLQLELLVAHPAAVATTFPQKSVAVADDDT
jgi:hypothetical protein